MKHQRRTLLTTVPLLAVALIFLAPIGPRSDGTLLVSVDRLQHRTPPAALVQQMRVLVELADRWLVRLPAADVAQLESAGVRHRVIDVSPYGDVLLLVRGVTADDLDGLRRLGALYALDSTTYLMATTAVPDRVAFPAQASIERIGEVLPVSPSFVPMNLGRAVARRSVVGDARYQMPIEDMVSQVDEAALSNTIKTLEAFKTRFAGTTSCEAAGDWLFDTFASFGLFVERDAFTFGPYTGRNIVATLPGRTSPAQVVIVAAHYDSYSSAASTSAPGADDNASGTAAVVELARVMSRHSFDFTVKFIGFSAEEWGLYGSKHYAQSARAAGEQILAVVNLDMVGFTDVTPEDLDLMVNGPSEWLANAFISAAALYAPMPNVKRIDASMRGSDHAPFWDQGYSALCGIEDMPLVNPNYHKVSDTVATLNMNFEASVARASLATVATLAQPYGQLPPPPQNVHAQAQTIGTALLRARSVSVTWTAAPGAVGYFVYRASTSRGPYQRLNTSALNSTSLLDRFLRLDVPYYYAVTSVNAGGVEGNYSLEAAVGK